MLAGQVGCRTRRMPERTDAGRTGRMQDRLDAGQNGCRKGLMQAGQVGCRTGRMQDRSDAGQNGCKKEWMQDITDTGHFGFIGQQRGCTNDGCFLLSCYLIGL